MKTPHFIVLLFFVAAVAAGAGWLVSGMLPMKQPVSQEQVSVSPESIGNKVFMDFFATNAEGTVVEKTEDSFSIERQGKRLSLVVQEQAGISTFFQENKDGSSVEKKFEDIKVGDRVQGGISISKPSSLFLVGSSSEGFSITAHRFVILSQGALLWPPLRLLGDLLFPKTDAHQIQSGWCYHPYGNWVSCGGANYCSGGTWKNDVTTCAYWGSNPYPAGYADHWYCYTNYGVPHGGSCGSPPQLIYFFSSPSTINSGNYSYLYWSSLYTSYCSAWGGWSGAKGSAGSQSIGPLYGSTAYGITCYGTYTGSVSGMTSVAVTSPPPTVSISASPNPTSYNGSATLSWSSTNATSCTAYAGQGFSGAKATSGSQTISNLTASQMFLILCSGAGGSAWGSTFVTVLSPPVPTASISANPASISQGNSSNLVWSSTNATSCTASGAWSGSRATLGSQSTGTLYSTQTYYLQCSGAGGTSNLASATVTVSSPPTVDIKANGSDGPIQIPYNSSSTLSWSSTNATSCTASGAWSGSKATAGSSSTGALTSPQYQYTLSCTGPGGTAIDSVVINVQQNPPPSVSPLAPTQGDYCGASSPPIFLAWQFIDPGDSQSVYRVQVDNNAGFPSPETDTGQVSSSSTQYSPSNLNYNTTLYWRVMVWDSQGATSPWTNGSSFTTATHQYPTSNFSWSPTNPGELQATQFTDTSQAYGGATKSAWSWAFQQGSPAISTQQNPSVQFTPVGIKQISLRITDSDGYSCQVLKSVNVQIPFPDWQEISPF